RLPRRRRRCGPVLATPGAGRPDRVRARRGGLASPPQFRAHVLEAAGGLWQSGSAARAQVAAALQRPRSPELAGPDLRPRRERAALSRPAGRPHLSRDVEHGPLPVALPARAGPVALAAPDAGVAARRRRARAALAVGTGLASAAARRAAGPPGRRGAAGGPGRREPLPRS